MHRGIKVARRRKKCQMDLVDLIDFADNILSIALPFLLFFQLWISFSVLLSFKTIHVSWTIVVFGKSLGCALLCTNNNRRHTLHNGFWKEKVVLQAFYLPLYPFHAILFHKIRANVGYGVLQILAILVHTCARGNGLCARTEIFVCF